MDLVRTANGLGCGFRETEVPNFPFFHELRHGANGVFDGDICIDAMLIVKVDHINAQAL